MVSTSQNIEGDNMGKVIIALSFGQGKVDQDGKPTPGKSNEALAKVVRKLCEKEELPLCLQWEIADCIPDLVVGGRDLVVREHREKGEYLDTREVIAQAWEFAERCGIKRAIVVAHPDHMNRCVKVAKKLGFEVEDGNVDANVADVPYDPDSIQEWTRSAVVFKPREKLAVDYYHQLGYID